MPLNWQASKRGHYSDSVIMPESELSIDIDVSSYNGVQVRPYKIAVANFSSEYALEFYFGAEPAVYVQPFTNIALDCANFTRCRIVNRGNKRIALRFIDKQLFDSMPGLFSAFPIQIPASGNDVLFHFDDAVGTNEGKMNGGVEIVATCSLDTNNVKFGESSLLCNGGGLIVGKSGYIDLANDFTCDAWVDVDISTIPNGSRMILFQFGNDKTGTVIRCMIARVNATTIQSYIYFNGTISSTANYALKSGYFHIALTKKGDVLRYFENGVLINTVTKITSGLVSSVFLGCDGIGDYNLIGNIDEWRFIKDVCFWTSNFTPPVSPYF